MSARLQTSPGVRGPDRLGSASLVSQNSSFGEWVACILILAAMLPAAWSFEVASLRLTPARVMLLFAGTYAMAAILLGPRCLRSDQLMALGGVWSFIALAYHEGVEAAAESAGIVTLELVGTYSVVRLWVPTPPAFLRLLSRLAILVVPLGATAMLESILHVPIARSLLGVGAGADMGARLGLMRAWATFDHPILLGVAMGGFFGLSMAAWRIRQAWWIPALATAAFLGTLASVSSGAAMVLVVIAAGLAWERMATRRFKSPWLALAMIVAGLWVLVDLVSNRPAMTVLVSYLTLSAETAHSRQLIWEWGFWHNAVPSPLFGIGTADWIRPSWMHSGSMDNYWLFVAVYSGIPAALMQLSAVILLIRRCTRTTVARRSAGTPALAWAITLVGVSMAGATVHFWNASLMMFGMLLGIGPALATGSIGRDSTGRSSNTRTRESKG